MTMTNKQLAILHVAKAKLKLPDAVYRSALVQIVGIESAKDLDQAGFEAMMGYLEYAGFRPLQPNGEDYGHRPGMATFAQLELIRTLWREYTRGVGDADSLNKWIAHSFKVTSLRFLRMHDARKAIVALKSMKARQAA